MSVSRFTTSFAASVLSIAMTAALTGCGVGDSSSSASGSSDSHVKGAVAMGFAGSDITIWNDQIEIMKPIIEKAGYKFLTDDPQWEISQQVSDWQAWINRGDVKAIAGYPVNPDAMVPVTAKAKKAGIPVFGYLLKWKGTAATTVVDARKGGFELGANSAKTLKGSGIEEDATVAVVGNRSSEFLTDATEGLIKGVKSVLPKAKVKELTALSHEEGYDVTKSQLTADPDTHVWLGASNDSILGVYEALLDQGVAKDDPKYYLASRDATNETLDLIKIPNSIYRSALVVPSKKLAKANAQLLIKGAEGKPTEDIVVPGVMVTAKNADDYYAG